MKSMIAILALLGVASASFYGSSFYPEHHQFVGPYHHLYNEEPIHTPWLHKSWPLASHQTYPYAKYFHGLPHKTHFEYPTFTEKEYLPYVPEHFPYVPEHIPFVPEHLPSVWERLAVPHKDISFSKYVSTPLVSQKYEHDFPYFTYPHGEKIYRPYEHFVPQYEKFLPHHEKFVPEFEKFVPHHERFVPEFEKFLPHHEKFVPEFEKFVPHHEKFVPEFEKFVPEFEKFVPHHERFVPEFEKFVPHHEVFVPEYKKFVPHHQKFLPHFERKWASEFVKPIETVVTKTLEAEKVVEIPQVHGGFPFLNKFDKFVPYWNMHFGYNPIVPHHHETTEFYPKFWEHRPYHFGLY